jgi:hypothetical protein
MTEPTHLQPPQNLLYTNANPRPETICNLCRSLIGEVFPPEEPIHLPIHPGCYCTYFPTHDPVTVRHWDFWALNDDTKHDWVVYVAWLLRNDYPIPRLLQNLIRPAEIYNQTGEVPPFPEPHSAQGENPIMADPAIKNTPTRTTTGRVLLQPRATNVSGRREYDCIFMQPGRVKQADQEPSNWLIPADVIRTAAPMFNSIPCYLDHPEMFGFGWYQNPQVKNLAGVTFDAHWSDADNALIGCIRLYDEKPDSPGAIVGALMDQMLADQAAGLEVPPVGLSAVIFQDDRLDEETGLRVTTNFAYAESMDIVYDPGAGGYVRAALAALSAGSARLQDRGQAQAGLQPRRIWQAATIIGGTEMPATEQPNQTPAPDAPPLPAQAGASPPASEPIPLDGALAAINRVSERIEALATQVEGLTSPPTDDTPVPDPVTVQIEALTAQVERLADVTASREETATIQGMGQPTRLFGGHTGLDQVEAALQAMVDGVRPADGVRPLTGIRELYHLMSGDFEMNGVFQEDRVYLANVTASTMAQITANVLNKRIVNLFQEYPKWWSPFISIEDFATLQDVRWITLGGVGELPTVAAGAAYTELVWDDLAQRESFTKKGGYLGITLEAIDKDDTRKLTAAPRALAQAAWLTLSKSISAIFTSNAGVGPNIYYDDSSQRALFHNSHSNLGTTALSWAAWDATRTAMRKQTELNSGERLGALTVPKFLLVPSDLETQALQYLASEGEPGTADNDENPFAQGDVHSARMRAARKKVIVVDLWTNTANWAAVADPNLWPTIGLGFRYGRVPEIFSVADPKAGLMFTNDTMPVKVRYFYATGPMGPQGLYKHNV